MNISPELRELFEKDFGKMLVDLALADAVINRDGVIFEWALRWIAEREAVAERRERERIGRWVSENAFEIYIGASADLYINVTRLQMSLLTPDNNQEI